MLEEENNSTKIEIKYEKPELKKNKKPLTADDIMKYEIASELGLMDKVMETGWKSLTARESGKIGGMMSSRKKEIKKKSMQNQQTNGQQG